MNNSGERLSWEEMLAIPPEKLNERARVPVKIFKEADELFLALAEYLAARIEESGKTGKLLKIGWPVGPKLQNPILVKLTNERRISWKNTVNFQVDEWLDWTGRRLPEDHPFHLKAYLDRELFSRIDPELRPLKENMFYQDPLHLASVDEALDRFGGLDIFLGGFGFTGHVAYNEPFTSRWHEVTNEEYCACRTRVVPSSEETIIMHSHRSTGGNTRMIPQWGITIGMKDILKSKKVILVSDGGAWKQTILRIMCFQEPTVKFPCTFLQLHPDSEIWVDGKTAACPVTEL